MFFGLNEDQRLIEQSLNGFLNDALPLDRIREMAGERSGFDAELWSGLVDLGVPGLLTPEAYGGAGLGMLEAALTAEALGYAAAPAPFVAAGVMAPLAIAGGADEAQRQDWLPAMAAGDMRVAVAMGAAAGATGEADLNLAGDRLSGRATGLLDHGGATHALLFLADGRAALVAIDGDGVKAAATPSLDRTRPLAEIELNDAAAAVLPNAAAVAAKVLDAGRIALAADTLGAGQRMIEKAVAYSGERVQFGRPISGFQAVKHMCAEMAAMLEPCRSLVWYAAHAQDQDDATDARLTACLAKAHLAEVGREVARTATEVHGGMGFTDLMGLHFWLKRIGHDRHVLGGPERCRQEAAAVQGWLD